jgi:CelD/BcsL family acetyltransferase involved in cellulose biosynthesis
MLAKQIALSDEVAAADRPEPPADLLDPDLQGFVVRSLPVSAEQPTFRTTGEYLCYTPHQYQHCYIDLSLGFEHYMAKFSSKTRSTIKRKLSRWNEHCGGKTVWREYRLASDMPEFFREARALSSRTYQERLLDAGLPDSAEFVAETTRLAEQDAVRAYLLFDGTRPVSYLFCPAQGNTLIYAHLGFDPDYLKHSVGTVLQWLALENLFAEGKFRYFDFTEGQSEHKLLFSTHRVQTANVFFVRNSVRNAWLLRAHHGFGKFTSSIGDALERAGVKSRVRKALRFGVFALWRAEKRAKAPQP